MVSWAASGEGVKKANDMTKKEADKLRNQKEPRVFGVLLDRTTLTPVREPLPYSRPEQDHGCDPLGDGTYRMVPSGDVVSYDEKCKRLAHILTSPAKKNTGFRL